MQELRGSHMDVLATCIYNGLSGTPYGGRLNRDAAYRESLATIAQTGLPIFCFVPAVDITAHRAYFRTRASDIVFVPLELHDVPHHPQIQRIKAQDPERYAAYEWQERCVEIMWGKFFMLERVLDLAPQAAHVYWIDAGLANSSIISTKYISAADLANYRLSEVGAAFPPKLFQRIRDFAAGKVVVLKTPNPHNPGIPSKYNSRPYTMPDGLIAGLFGGPRHRVAELCALFREKVDTILEDEVLFFEESILTGIHADRPDLFQSFTFDTWYHEGWPSFDPNVVNFSQFFDLMLETPPSERVEFPWNHPDPQPLASDPSPPLRATPRATPMTTEEDLVDLTLHHMGRTGLRPSLVAIGAMDGVTFDDFHGYVTMYEWSGLFVEPIPELFRRLRENYARLSSARDNKYENSAIADHDGTVQMLTIDQAAIAAGAVHECFAGMSAIYPPRNGLASAEDAATVAKYGALIDVNCLTLRTLFERHAIDRVDLLCIDAEGWDYRIIEQLDFTTYRPKLIRCEYINLTADEQAALVTLLADNGYLIRIHGQNIDAVATEYWQELKANRAATVPVAAHRHQATPTLVTALIDLSLGASDLRLRGSFARYLDDLKQLLRVDWPMVIFVQPQLEEMIWRYRQRSSTYVVHKSLADLEAFPFSAQVREINKGIDRAAHGGHTPERQEPRPALYPALVLSKQFFLNDATLFNPFDTDDFLWIDGDIASAIGDPTTQLTTECRRHLSHLLSDHRMLYVCRPITAAAEFPGFNRSGLDAFTGQAPEHIVRGRVFGGTRRIVNAINGIYYGTLSRTLESGYMGTEDEVLTIVSHTHRHLCNLQMLDDEARLRGFFARLQDGVPEPMATTA